MIDTTLAESQARIDAMTDAELIEYSKIHISLDSYVLIESLVTRLRKASGGGSEGGDEPASPLLNDLLCFDCPSYEKPNLRCMFGSRRDFICGDSACVITPPHELTRMR